MRKAMRTNRFPPEVPRGIIRGMKTGWIAKARDLKNAFLALRAPGLSVSQASSSNVPFQVDHPQYGKLYARLSTKGEVSFWFDLGRARYHCSPLKLSGRTADDLVWEALELARKLTRETSVPRGFAREW